VRWWRPLSPDTWQAPSAPDISYMVGPIQPFHSVHICQSGPACSFYYRPGPATERLVYQGRIKGILRLVGGVIVLPCGALRRPKLPNCTVLLLSPACISCRLTNVFVRPATREPGIGTPKDFQIRIYRISRAIFVVLHGGKRGQGSAVSARLQLISVSVVDKMCCHL